MVLNVTVTVTANTYWQTYSPTASYRVHVPPFKQNDGIGHGRTWGHKGLLVVDVDVDEDLGLWLCLVVLMPVPMLVPV